MPRALQKLVRNGNSTAVALPRPLLFYLGWLPGEAVIVHRSHLRHPARRGSRLHMQELAELEKMGLPVTEPQLKAALEAAS